MVSTGEEDDTMALRAALTMIDDWDSDLSSLFDLSNDGCDSSSSSSSDVSRPIKSKVSNTKTPYKPRRNMRKLEIAALRAEVEELKNVVALEKILTTLGASRSVESAALQMEWERLATTQQQERVAAEVENAKLRKLAESQLKHAQQLLKLTKRVNQLADAMPVAPPDSFENYHVPPIDYRVQLECLDELARRATEIFSSDAFASDGRSCFREVLFSPQTHASDGVDLIFQAAWMLPFEVERVADALWVQSMRPSFKLKTVAYRNVYEDEQTLVSKFLATPTHVEWGASQGQIAGRLIANADDGSYLIVVKTNARTYAGSQWRGSATLDGWLHIERVASETKTLSGPVSRVRWYRRTLFQPPADAKLTETQRRKWTNAVISGPSRSRFEQDMDWTVQAIDNMLLTPKDGYKPL